MALMCEKPMPQDWISSFEKSKIDKGQGAIKRDVKAAKGTNVVFEVESGPDRWVEKSDGKNRTRIMSLVDEAQLYHVGFVGQDLILTVADHPVLVSTFFTSHWSASSNRLIRIAASDYDSQGEPIVTPDVYPIIVEHYVYWSQTLASDPTRTVTFRYDTKTGDKIQAPPSYGLTPVLVGSNLLLQAVVDTPDSPRHFLAMNLDLSPAILPSGLATATDFNDVRSDGTTLVWTSTTNEFGYWRLGWDSPKILIAPIDYVWEPNVFGDIATFATVERPLVVDLRTGAWTKVTTEYGAAYAANEGLLVIAPSPTKESDYTAYFVNTAELSPLPAC